MSIIERWCFFFSLMRNFHETQQCKESQKTFEKGIDKYSAQWYNIIC